MSVVNLNLEPMNTALVFDLHGVVFKFQIWACWRDFWQAPNKGMILLAAVNPFLIYDVLKLLVTSGVVEASVLAIEAKYPYLKSVIPFALKIVNNQTLRPEMFKLLCELKNAGYTLLIFSNIGEHSMVILQQKYPELFSLFVGELHATKADQYVQKPQPAAWRKFKTKFAYLKHLNLVLIDDKQRNLAAAAQAGFQVLKFQNVATLRSQLLV